MNIQNTIRHIFAKKYKISPLEKANPRLERFSVTEKLIFGFFFVLAGISSLILLFQVNKEFLVDIPAHGGVLTEGVVGLPRFINPLLAISDADRDLTALVYSGLMKATPEGDLVYDIAESVNISEDGKVYTFIIRDGALFHDGAPVTADDVAFTIETAKDPQLKSSKRANWEGVEVQVIGEKEIHFILKQPYAPFLENTTLGILPKHVWKNATAEEFAFSNFNIYPVGAGPYAVESVKRDGNGLPVRYSLKSFDQYGALGPYIERIVISFYANESELIKAYRKGAVEAINGISPSLAKEIEKEGGLVLHTPLPRVFGIFFNQNQQSLFTEKALRQALNVSLSKERIVNEVLWGYGEVINGPIPTSVLSKKDVSLATSSTKIGPEAARALLEKNGWKLDENGVMDKKGKKLSFSISTSNIAELKATAEIVKEEWEKIGVKVEIKIFEPGDLNQNVIRPRKYDALLFGEIIGRDLDLYPFWHSSQRNDPGLNIALYTNITADKLLESSRTTLDVAQRQEQYEKFQKEVLSDVPAVFTYAPEFIYVASPRVKNLVLGEVTVPHERFLGIENWYIETEQVWQFFVRNQ